jgi:excisionase family DNA binding protein
MSIDPQPKPDQMESELLTIREAASFLNVSPVSLRRWTDAGKLSCLRVGGRRERRFYKHDLLKFMGDAETATDMPEARRSSGAILEGLLIDYGSHLCSIYETDLGRVKMAVPFLAEGVRKGDTCIVIAGADSQSQIQSGLRDVVGDALAQQVIVSGGEPTGDQMYSFLEAQFIEATRDGGRGLRVVGDMAWSLDKGMTPEELQDFEMRFDQYLAHAYPVISLCQYDARRFSGVGLLGALKTHQDTFDFPLPRFLAS